MSDASKKSEDNKGALAGVLVLMVIVLCTAGSGCISIKQVIEPAEELLGMGAHENATQVLSLSEEASIKKLNVSIVDVWVDTRYTFTQGSRVGSFNAPPGYVYLFIRVHAVDERGAIETFTSPRTFGSDAFTVEDERGVVYGSAPLYVAEDALPMLYSVPRGEEMEGTVLFKVPEQDVITNITYTDLVYTGLSAVWRVNKSIDELKRAHGVGR
ncbi:MAG: DUF4352 domain-containing protein [Methermicoccaceae archaeon]